MVACHQPLLQIVKRYSMLWQGCVQNATFTAPFHLRWPRLIDKHWTPRKFTVFLPVSILAKKYLFWSSQENQVSLGLAPPNMCSPFFASHLRALKPPRRKLTACSSRVWIQNSCNSGNPHDDHHCFNQACTGKSPVRLLVVACYFPHFLPASCARPKIDDTLVGSWNHFDPIGLLDLFWLT